MFEEVSDDEDFLGFPSQANASGDVMENIESHKNNNTELFNNNSDHDLLRSPLCRPQRRRYKTKQYNASTGAYE